MIKICHITSTPQGSIPRILRECSSAVEEGMKPYVVVQGKSYEKDGISFIGVKQAKNKIYRMLITSVNLYREAKKVKADIYQIHDPELLPFALKENIKSVLRFFFSCRLKDFKYLLVFILLPALVFAATLEINPEIPGFVLPGIMLMTTLIGGGNEEGGWRGILQPGLEHFMPYPAAVILTSLLWSFWHIPLWFVEDSAQQHTPFLGFCFIGLLLSFWLAAVYRRTRSVFCCMLLHGFTNTLMSSFVMDVNSPLILSLLLLTVLSLLMVYRPFSRRKAGQKPGQAED